jgi:hypothetical protein
LKNARLYLALNNLRSYSLLLPILVLAILLQSVLPTHAVTYATGVTVGHWARFAPVNVTYHGTVGYSLEPQPIKDLKATVQITGTVQRVSSTYVTLESVTQYNNATTKTATRYGDLLTGIGNLTFGLIAGGLSAHQRSTRPGL